MRPFFSYYGGKWRGAKYYGPPRRDPVIEPFAGSAAYSTYYEAPNVRLYDISETVCEVWDWLINCSEEDVRRMPVAIRSNEEWESLPLPQRQIIYWAIHYGQCDRGSSIPEWFLHYHRTGEVTGSIASYAKAHRDAGSKSTMEELVMAGTWSARKRDRIIRQKPLIANWKIENLDYRDIDLEEAHWHVDPPYQGSPGRKYPHNDIDFDHLGKWCMSLPGAVDVCEQEGADWLPFGALFDTHTSGGGRGKKKRTREVLWRSDPEPDLFGDES